MQEKCPIERLKRYLLEQGVAESELARHCGRGQAGDQEAVEGARAAARPDPATVLEYVYSAPSLAGIPG